MSLKMKLISIISAFTLVLGLLIMGVFAVNQAQVDMGGSITFNADDVYARVTGSVANAQVAPNNLDVTYSAYETEGDPSAWEELDLLFDSQGTPVVITITVENLSTERSLTVNLTDTISSSTPNLNKSLQRDSSTYSSGTNITLDPKDNGTSTTTFTITLSVADRNQSLNNAQFDYDLNLYDESAVPEPPETYQVFGFQLIEGSTNEVEITSYPTGISEVVIPATFSVGTTPVTSFTINEDGTSDIPGDSTGEFAMMALYLGGFYYTPQGGERTYCANFMEFASIADTLAFPIYFEPQYKLSLGEYSEENLQMFQMYIQLLSQLQGVGYSDGNFYFTTADGQYNNTLVNAADIYNSLSSVQDPTKLQSMFPMQLNLVSPFGVPVYVEGNDYTVVGFADGTRETGGSSAYWYTGAFSNDLDTTTIYIPKTVRYIGDYTFAVGNWNGQGDRDKQLANVIFEDGSQLERIGDGAFTNCVSLNSINLPSSLTSIGSNAFSNCDGLTSISLPSSLTSIGDGIFSGCNNIQPTAIDALGVKYLGTIENPYLILWNGRGMSSTIDYTVNLDCKIIDSQAFYSSSIASITFPAGLSRIGASAFMHSNVTAVNLSNCTNLTSIGDNAFSYSGLTSIELPSSLTSIGGSAFSYSGLTGGLDLSNCTSLTSIGGGAFYECDEITSISLPSSLISIGRSAFVDCYALTSIILPSSLTSIGGSAFANCSGLTVITLPDGLTSIRERTFSGCSGLTNITLPDGLTSIGDSAFANCSGLTSISLPSSLTSIGEGAFQSCSGLTSITVEEGNSVFHSEGNCLIDTDTNTLVSGCKTSVIPSYITSIGDSAFYNCDALIIVDLSNCTSLTSIGEGAFYSCGGLTSITLPSSLTSVRGTAFRYCSNLTEVIIDSEYAYTNATSASACGWVINYATTVKVLTSLVSDSHAYINTTNFPSVTTEVIDGKNYTVYSK